MNPQEFEQTGYALTPNLLSAEQIDEVTRFLAKELDDPIADRSLLRKVWCRTIAEQIKQNGALASLLSKDSIAIQCTYFEKTLASNWLVAFHQDLSVPVLARVDHPELTGWSLKDGVDFLQAPQCMLQELTAVRIHLDACGIEDGALRVIPGSHLLGRIPQKDIALFAEQSRRTHVTCTSMKGGGLAMRPLLLHASSRSTAIGRRRVLHFTFGPKEPPFGLEWRTSR